ncbi:Acetyltransferase [compost metagenome]
MAVELEIKQLQAIGEHAEELAELLIRVVEDGASIGFLPPLPLAEALAYWESVCGPEVILFIAKIDGHIVGSVQLHICSKLNGIHRVELAKLMTHPDYRRRGIGRLLMQHAEDRARREGKTLIVLDTREGDPSNLLYTSMGYSQAGRIPGYALSADGSFDATIIYYKSWGPA